MAQRRMFSLKITNSDPFTEMPLSTQALYFHLAMNADDDGFVDGVKRIQRSIGASDDDLKLLIAKCFIIPFESGIVVIRQWRIHNYIQKDRYVPTIHTEEFQQLKVVETGEKGSYVRVYEQLRMPVNMGVITDVSKMDTECIQNVSNLDTQVRVGKGRLELESGEDSIGAGDSALSEAEKALVSMWREHGITLTIEEARELEAKLTPQVFDRYFHNLDNFLRRNPTARTGSQYELILRWAREDGAA